MKGLWEDAAISPAMCAAIAGWQRAFYGNSLSGLPGAITGTAATLVTNELEVQFGNSRRGKFLEEALAPLLPRLHLAVQLAAAFGQVVLRPMLYGGRFYYTLAGPGQFFPQEFDPEGNVTKGYFADPVGEYVKLEQFDFQAGRLLITQRAHFLKNGVLGREVPLSVHPGWVGLEQEMEITHCPGPLFGVIKMPFANLVDGSSPLPVSLYAGAMDSMEEFDRVYGELIYELHSGKRKNLVERSAIVPEHRRRRGSRYLDPTTDTYILDPAEEHSPFQDYSPSIRTGEYLEGLQVILHMIENQCHLSPGTLSLNQKSGGVTATEIISQDRTTYNTCAAIQTRGVTPGLMGVIRAVETMGEVYHLIPEGQAEVSVCYGDGIFEDTQKEFDRRMEMVREGVLTGQELRQWYFGK